jgi:hypothetical protein
VRIDTEVIKDKKKKSSKSVTKYHYYAIDAEEMEILNKNKKNSKPIKAVELGSKLGTDIMHVTIPHPHPWLIHAADALTLSTSVLKLPINQLRRAVPWPPLPLPFPSTSLSSSSITSVSRLNVMILNRKDTRAMENIQEVYEFFTSSSLTVPSSSPLFSSKHRRLSSKDNTNKDKKKKSSLVVTADVVRNNVDVVSTADRKSVAFDPMYWKVPPSNVTMFMTEDQPFETQARSFAQADIVVSIHGAGETNILFMKPCSILIEIYPWQYTPVYFFHGLANKVGMIHEYWEANRTEKFPFFKKEDADCNKQFHPVWFKYQDGIGGRKKNETINAMLRAECVKKGSCVTCARLVPSVEVSIPMLHEKLAMGLRRRQSCIHRLVNAGVYQYST